MVSNLIKRLPIWSIIDPMKWFLGDAELKKRLLQLFIIVSRTEDPHDTHKIFYEILTPARAHLPRPLALLYDIGKKSPVLLSAMIHFGFGIFAGRFIAGTDILSIADTVNRYHLKGSKANIDVLGDAVLCREEEEQYINDYIRIFTLLPKYLLPGCNVSASLKITAVYSQIDPFRAEYSADAICERIGPLIAIMANERRFVFLDALEKDYREIQLLVFKKLYRKYGEIIAFVVQSVFGDSKNIFDALIYEAKEVGSPLWTRLVMGAYWPYEQHIALRRNWKNPVFEEKEHTNESFRRLFRYGATSGLSMVTGTNNAEHIIFGLKNGAKEVQLLLGMGEPYAEILNRYAIPNRFYMPALLTGSLGQAIGYLLRRADDITGEKSYQRRMYEEKLHILRYFEDEIKQIRKGEMQ